MKGSQSENSVWFQLYDILEKAKLWRQDYWLPGAEGKGRKGWIGKAQRIFRTVKLFCITLQWWIYGIIHLSKLIDYKTPKYHCGGVMSIVRKLVMCMGARGIWKPSALFTQLCCKPKMLWKQSLLKIRNKNSDTAVYLRYV